MRILIAVGLTAGATCPPTGRCAAPESGWQPPTSAGQSIPGLQNIGPVLEPDGRSAFGLSPQRAGNDQKEGQPPSTSRLPPETAEPLPDSPYYAGSQGESPPTAPPILRFFQLPEERFRGIPAPLVRESWRHRPLSLGALFGFIEGGALIEDWVEQDTGVIAGFRIGWDHQNYWGLEMRFAWASLDTYNGWRAEQAAGYPNAQAIYPGGSNDMFFWDTNLLWYPTGDTRWRPFLAAGLGLATVDFADALGTQWSDTMFALPLSLGLKYRCTDRVALRLEATENLLFGSRPIGSVQNLSVTGGVEWRFGGSRRAYWPWNPGRHYW